MLPPARPSYSAICCHSPFTFAKRRMTDHGYNVPTAVSSIIKRDSHTYTVEHGKKVLGPFDLRPGEMEGKKVYFVAINNCWAGLYNYITPCPPCNFLTFWDLGFYYNLPVKFESN